MLIKVTFEPIGEFTVDAPEQYSETIDQVTAIVAENGGSWKFWKGSLSVMVDGRKTNPKMAALIRSSNPTLIAAFNWVTSVESWERYVSEEQRDSLVSTGLPRVIKELIAPFLAFTTYGPAKVRRILVRQAMTSQTWRVVEDPIGFLGSVRYEGGNLLRYLNAELDRLRVESKTTWGLHPKMGAMSFTRAYEEFELEKRIMEDMDFFKDLVPFTNDPEKPAEAYFPTSGALTGSWDAWARFETQIPSSLLNIWRAAIRGIIDDRNSSRQIIYLRDSGYTAKSQVMGAIQKRMDGLSASLDEDALKSTFWFAGIYGARFISMPDVLDKNIVTNPKIKRLTGRDYCRNEAKGVNAFDVQPNARIVAAGQVEQLVDVTSPAEQTRILYFPLQRNDDPEFVKSFVKCDAEGNPMRHSHWAMQGAWMYKGNTQFANDLYEQFWDYMHVCDEAYTELCPNHGDIPMPEEMLELLINQCSSGDTSAYLDILQHLIDFGPEKRLSNPELKAM